MKTKYTLLISLLFTTMCISQPDIEWQKSLGGSDDESAELIIETSDGGYIIAGSSYSNDGDVSGNHGEFDYWIVKLSEFGNLEWQKSYGGSFWDVAHSIQEVSSGGYIVAGSSQSNNGDVTGNHGFEDYWIIKISLEGILEWQKTYGGSYSDVARSIYETNDGGYVVAGYSESNDGDVTGNHGELDYWIIKISLDGTLEWQKSLGGSALDFGFSIEQTIDGGYIIAGTSRLNNGDITGNHGGGDFWIVKLNSSGNLEWQKSFGGSEEDAAQSIRQTLDGGYIVVGFSNSNDGDVSGNHGGDDYWVVKLNSIGNLEWQKALGGSDLEYAHSIQQTLDDGFIIAGRSASNDGDVTSNYGENDYWIVKLTPEGNILWQKSLGGSDFDVGFSIQEVSNGAYIVVGSSRSIDGNVSGNHGSWDYWVVKLGSELGIDDFDFETVNLYPNPTSGIVTIEAENLSEINIYDSLGKLSFRQKMENVNNQTIDVSHLSKGIYTIIITTIEGEDVKKLIVK